MKFFNIDQHISVIYDMQHLFRELGHQVHDWSISNHTWVLNKEKKSIPLLENDNWKRMIKSKLWNEFFKQYQQELKDYDGFIACYSPMFAMLYQKFDRPVIINIPIRYEHPFSFDRHDWKRFNKFLVQGVDDGRIILVANNAYDKYYTEYFLDREVVHIPSMCDYYQKEYSGGNSGFICFSRQKRKGLSARAMDKDEALGQKYSTEDLIKFSGIIHFPYQVSFMSLFEQYAMNLPLFFPSQDFLMELYARGDDILKEASWYRYFGRKPGSLIRGRGPHDPNDYTDLESVRHWIRFADYYDVSWMPFVQLFHSLSHLNSLMETCDSAALSKRMKSFNVLRKQKIINLWRDIINHRM